MFYDYHTHSSYSDDSPAPLKDMLTRAAELGLAEIAVTDHFDPGYPDKDYPFELEFDKYHQALEAAQEEYKGRLRVVKGIEIGIMDDQLDRCRSAAEAYPYDYIIGSFHCALGEDLHSGHFFDGKSAKESYIDYFTYMYENLRIYKDYSNIGHMNLVARYCQNGTPDFKEYSDICEAIFKMIIHEGRGIELNTSSFRYNMSVTCPSEELLRLYRSLGGEIITIGSDAHTPDKLIDNFDFAVDYLKSLGFRYISTFEKRKPSFVKL